jgi:hypothetical protein
MLRKSLLTISFLLTLTALSATAHAGSTITNKSYWPNEASRSAPFASSAQDRVNSAFAYDRGISAVPNEGRSVPHYQGGPKSR